MPTRHRKIQAYPHRSTMYRTPLVASLSLVAPVIVGFRLE
jgi:hypothetical protein